MNLIFTINYLILFKKLIKLFVYYNFVLKIFLQNKDAMFKCWFIIYYRIKLFNIQNKIQ